MRHAKLMVDLPGSDDDAPADEKRAWATQLRASLARAKALRQGYAFRPQDSRDRLHLRQWQAARLARTHADLLASERHGPAAEFFLTDLYGPKDFSERDSEVERILPTLIAVLPAAGVRTVAMAVEVDALSEELDAAMIDELRRAGRMNQIAADAYAEAYRRCGNSNQRKHQIALIFSVGEALERLTKTPLLGAALRIMRTPAHLAGLAELHAFLERGYATFRRMGGADEFLRTIVRRETQLMNEILSGGASGLR